MKNTVQSSFSSRVVISLIAWLSTALFAGCGIYSFTGASISPDVKTVTVQFFPNQAPIVNPALSQNFTERLKDRFVSGTSLRLVGSNGDLNLSGAITDYEVSAVARDATTGAALNRLTITVRAEFVNNKDNKQNFSTTFSRFADFSAAQSLGAVESSLNETIVKQLCDDVFTKAVVNW